MEVVTRVQDCHDSITVLSNFLLEGKEKAHDGPYYLSEEKTG